MPVLKRPVAKSTGRPRPKPLASARTIRRKPATASRKRPSSEVAHTRPRQPRQLSVERTPPLCSSSSSSDSDSVSMTRRPAPTVAGPRPIAHFDPAGPPPPIPVDVGHAAVARGAPGGPPPPTVPTRPSRSYPPVPGPTPVHVGHAAVARRIQEATVPTRPSRSYPPVPVFRPS